MATTANETVSRETKAHMTALHPQPTPRAVPHPGVENFLGLRALAHRAAVALWLLRAVGNLPAQEPPPIPLSLSDVFTSAPAAATTPTTTPEPAPEDSNRALPDEEALVMLDQAERLYAEGRKVAARSLAQRVAAHTSAQSPAAHRASLLLARLADSPEAALPHLETLGGADNESLAAEATRVALTWVGRAEGDRDKASAPGTQRLLDLACKLARQSNHPPLIEEAQWTRARFLARTEHPAKAYQLLAEARRTGTVAQPGPRWLALEGETALAIRRLPEAQVAFEELVDRFPERPEAREILGRLGLLLELNGQSDAALQCYSRYARAGANLRDSIWVERRARSLASPYFPPQSPGGVK